MEEAFFLIGWILCCLVWRYAAECAESGCGRRLPSLLNWYSAIYVMMAIFLYRTVRSMYLICQDVPWLDPMLTRDLVQQREIELLLKKGWTSLNMTQWDECCNLTDYEPLIYFAMSAPFWAVASFVLCLAHTFMHLRQAKKKARAAGDATDRLMKYNLDRDQAIAVCILPTFYCLMALRGLLHVWLGIVNDTSGLEWIDTLKHRVEFQFEMLESCFLVGDVYEAYALLLFANVTMNVIQQQGVSKLQAAEATLATASDELNVVLKQQESFFSSLHSTTVLGVLYFALSCFVAAAYSLTTLSFQYMNSPLKLTPTREQQLDAAIMGAGFMTSMAAVQNLVVIERAYGHSLLHEYKPMRKFWSAKVLVSLVFMQKVVLVCPPLCHWSEAKQQLLYAAVMCVECCGLSLFHILAWGHSEEWYEPLKAARKKKDEQLRRTRAAQRGLTQATQRNSSGCSRFTWFSLSRSRTSPPPTSELEVGLQ